MHSPNPFILSRFSEKKLRDDFQTYYGLFRHTKCTGSHLEELVCRALQADPMLDEHVEWRPGSHAAEADIYIHSPSRISLSIKSGTRKPSGFVYISGNRLTKYRGDYNLINRGLRELVSDVMLCFLHDAKDACYQVVYIDAPVFTYPTHANVWEAKVGNKSGRPGDSVWHSSTGLLVTLKPSLSWQVWWTIPLSLCRIGNVLRYG